MRKKFFEKKFFEKNLRILKIRFVIQCLKKEINRCVRSESVHDNNDYLLHSIFLANFGGFTEMVTDIQTEGQMDGQRCVKEKFLFKHSIDAVKGHADDIKGHADGVKGHAVGVKGQMMA